MAIFTSDNKQPNGRERAATIIALGTKIKGDVITECHFHVDGDFEGSIKSKSTVIVGKDGVLKGDVTTQKIVISGKFVGTIEAKTIEIMPHGRLEGSISTDELIIERKGIFIGESKQNAEIKLLDKKPV